MSLYNCKHDGDEYRITKFDKDMNVEASYLTTLTECECPAGHRDTCRHRQMLPKFIAKEATKGQWFLNFEAGRWIAGAIEEEEIFPPLVTVADLPPNINLLDLANIGEVHNAIARAVGEPELPIAPKPLRRL